MTFIVEQFLYTVFVLSAAYYFMSALQWYSYKLERIIFHYHRYDWHVYFFLIPLLAHYVLMAPYSYILYSVYPLTLFLWARKIDKKLVFTGRVKRYGLFLGLILLLQIMVYAHCEVCGKLGVIIPLFLAHLLSLVFETIAFEGYKKEARKKLALQSNMKVIAITASYGKTSIKNFLAQILSTTFSVYATPRSVNTLGGIVKDINENLPPLSEIYIVEAGARAKGDIYDITTLVHPHIAIVGSIGEQHIEYFKTLDNIRNTKMELLASNRLEKAFVHTSAHVLENEKVILFGDDIEDLKATLEGISFSLTLDGQKTDFTCNLLGGFNAINLAAAIHVAYALGVPVFKIQEAISKLKGVEHRLQKIEAGGKLIIDDSFNGNLEGMLSSYELVSTYSGRKVIITPGLVESTPEANALIAQKMDTVFDMVIITGKSNLAVLDENIHHAEKIILHDKALLQSLLAEKTLFGDLILFSNDAPSFV